MADKNKTVHYRVCRPHKNDTTAGATATGSFNLQQALNDAREIVPLPWKRPINLDKSRSHHLTIFTEKKGCLCGVFVLCDKDKRVALVDVEANGAAWQGTADPKDDTGKRRELQEQELFFAIRENHIAIIQPLGLTLRDLHEFFVWFIQTQANVAPGWGFHFQNVPTIAASKRMEGKKISSIKIGKDAYVENKTPIPKADGKTEKRQRFTKTIEPNTFFQQVLEDFGIDDVVLDDLNKCPDVGQIWLEVEIRYKSRTIKDSQNVMHAIAATLGDRTDLRPTISLGKDGTIEGKELTIKDVVSVQVISGNVANDDAITKLADWLTKGIEGGTIPV